MKKNWMTAGLITILGAGSIMPAQAINKEWSAVAGFVGGVLVANAAHRPSRTYYVNEPAVVYRPAPVVVERNYYYAPPPRPVVRRVQYERYECAPPPPPSGHYEYRTEWIWVPGCWVYEDTGCGSRQVWQPGYYETVRNKVWVSTCRY